MTTVCPPRPPPKVLPSVAPSRKGNHGELKAPWRSRPSTVIGSSSRTWRTGSPPPCCTSRNVRSGSRTRRRLRVSRWCSAPAVSAQYSWYRSPSKWTESFWTEYSPGVLGAPLPELPQAELTRLNTKSAATMTWKRLKFMKFDRLDAAEGQHVAKVSMERHGRALPPPDVDDRRRAPFRVEFLPASGRVP